MSDDLTPTAPPRTTTIPVREPVPGPHVSPVDETSGDAVPEPGSGSGGSETSRAPGLEAGGTVAPGDTPPTADSMSGAAGDARRDTPNMGPVSGNRTPMLVALGVLLLVVLMVAGLTGASFLPL